MDSQLSFISFSKKIETRTTTDIFLVGSVSPYISEMKLSTCRQVLSVFFHHNKIEKKTFEKVQGVSFEK